MAKKVIALSIDAEFTAFDMIGGDMISLGCVEILEDYTLGREWSGKFRPRSQKYFTEGAREVHGISYFKALEFPEPRKTLIELLHWLAPIKDQFHMPVAHWGSWNFDLKWVEHTFQREDLISSYYKAFRYDKEFNINVYQMARKMLKHIPIPPGKDEKESKKGQYKLDNVCRFLDIELDHHEALSDARGCALVYCSLMKKENVWTGELF